MMMMKNTFWKVLIMATGLAFAAGCSTTSSAPFHMYSSPLLEGELAPMQPAAPRGVDDGGSPGVQSRQVYAYHHRQPVQEAPSQPTRQIRPGQPAPRFDTVEPSSQPVLANYRSSESTGAGRVVDDEGSSTESSSNQPRLSGSQESVEFDEEDRASLSAAYLYTVLALNEVEFDDDTSESVTELYRSCRTDGDVYHSNRPNIGDLIFFHNTYDANQDGRNNDWYTMVGMVEAVHSYGTIDFLAYHEGRVQRLQLNLEEVDSQMTSQNRTANSLLRAETPEDAPFTQYLAGQLFAGFCNILGDRQELVIVDNWTPEMNLVDDESTSEP